jgi:preprotein translocase subunit SecF
MHSKKMENQNTTINKKKKIEYDKVYKLLLIIPGIILVLSLAYLFVFYQQNNDFVNRDISLKGGTSITVFIQTDITELNSFLSEKLEEFNVREISNLRTGQQEAFIVESSLEPEQLKPIIEEYLQENLTEENSSIEFTGAMIGEGFYKQILSSILVAFLCMGWVIFFIFGKSLRIKGITLMLTFVSISILFQALEFVRALAVLGILSGLVMVLFDKHKTKKQTLIVLGITVVSLIAIFIPFKVLMLPLIIILVSLYVFYSMPSFAVILSAFADLVMTLAVINLMGLRISAAGIVAFLMLIGYSVDSDVLLTTRVLKEKHDTLNKRLKEAFKTGMTMTLTSLAAIIISLLITKSFSYTLQQIFTILTIGLTFDMMNTWISNAGILKWYLSTKKGIKEN